MLRIFLFTILACLFASVLCAQSQAPAPAPREKGSPQQEKTQSTAQQPATDQRGTEQSPLIVKTIQPPKTQDEIERDRKEHKEKAANDRKLVVFTAVLAGVAVLQFFSLIWQAILFRKSLAATKLAADAAKQSAEVAEKALAIGERAYLVVDQFKTSHTFAANIPLEIRYNITNVGGTPGIITGISAKAEILEKLPDQPIYEVRTRGKEMIGSGTQYGLPMQAGSIVGITNEQYARVRQKTLTVFVYGKVSYSDIFDDPHETGFCAQWDFETAQFVPSNVPGYNFWT